MAQLRSLATVSGFTAISRVLGFLRDVLIGHFIGVNQMSDAFFTAFRFPNMFRRIFGEGAFNAAFVPLFAKKLENDGEKEAVEFGSNTFSLLAWVLTAVTLVAIPLMGWIMSLVAPGFKAKFDSGWTSPGAMVANESAIPISGAKRIFLVYSGESESATTQLDFQRAELVGKSGERVSLWDFVVETSVNGRLIPPDEEGASEFRLLEGASVECAFPRQHVFEGLEIEAGVTGGEGRLELYRNHPQTFPLTVTLGRITFIYLLCMSLTAHLSGVLNTVRIFGMPAAAPIMLNVVSLIGLLLFVGVFHLPGGHVLAWCVFLAGFLQLAVLWWTCWRQGYRIRLRMPKVSPEVKRLFWLMGPGVMSAGIQQINLFVGGIIASKQETAVSYLYYSDRVYQLPLGMVGIAFGVVLLPDITRKVRAKKHGEAIESMNRGIEYSLLITLPATIALLVIAYPIVSGLFEWGEKFTAVESRFTAAALSAFAVGLPAYVLVKVLQPGYFARENTKTPMYFAAITVLTNIVLSLLFFWMLRSRGIGHVGIALATSLAAWVNVALLAVGLFRRGYLKIDRRLLDKLWRIGICTSMMGLLLMFLYQSLEAFLLAGRWQCLMSLILLVGIGLVSYAASAFSLGATSAAELRQGFRRG